LVCSILGVVKPDALCTRFVGLATKPMENGFLVWPSKLSMTEMVYRREGKLRSEGWSLRWNEAKPRWIYVCPMDILKTYPYYPFDGVDLLLCCRGSNIHHRKLYICVSIYIYDKDGGVGNSWNPSSFLPIG
jgi:hypothetical protein